VHADTRPIVTIAMIGRPAIMGTLAILATAKAPPSDSFRHFMSRAY